MGIISVKGKHTDNIEEYERNKRSDASFIFSDAATIEEFSIELSAGNQWAEDISKEKAVMYEVEGDELSIKPQTSIVLEVKENIHVPFNMYGMILQTGSIFLEQGILIGAGKIEPSFDGKLKLLIYNTSKTRRTIKKGQKIASAIFMRTDKTLNASIYKNNRTSVKRNRTHSEKFSDFFSSNRKFIISQTITIATSSLVVFFLTLHFSKDTRQRAEKLEEDMHSQSTFKAEEPPKELVQKEKN